MPTLIRWWEALKYPAKWQQKYSVDWDATDGRNGGAQQYSLGSIDGDGEVQIREPNKQCGKYWWKWKDLTGEAGSRRSRSFGLGAGPGEGLRAGQSSCGVGLGDALQFPKEDLAVLCVGTSSTRGEYS